MDGIETEEEAEQNYTLKRDLEYLDLGMSVNDENGGVMYDTRGWMLLRERQKEKRE